MPKANLLDDPFKGKVQNLKKKKEATEEKSEAGMDDFQNGKLLY